MHSTLHISACSSHLLLILFFRQFQFVKMLNLWSGIGMGILQNHRIIVWIQKCESGAVSCDVLKKALRRQDTLKNCPNIHSGQRLLSREVCKTFLKQGSSLETPYSHGSECQFSCDICKKSFKHQYNLKLHERTRSGESPFSHDVCNKSFDHLRYLKKHLLIHGNERPFFCGVCNKSFRQLSDLRRYVLIHGSERPCSCEVCN